MVTCDFCGKIFKYNYLLEKHMLRKVPCFTNLPPQTATENSEKESKNFKNVCQKLKNVCQDFTCSKCDKRLSSAYYARKHEERCNGDSLQCPVCLRVFSDRTAKYKHKKRCKPVDATGGTNITITNNITNNYVINWSNENYDHVSPQQIANVLKRCLDVPIRFFSEFPKVAHQNEHANLKLTNLRGNYVDAYEDGRFIKMSTQSVMNDCATRMIYRLDDASGSNEQLFQKFENITQSLVDMEYIINDRPNDIKNRVITSLKMMQMEIQDAKHRIMRELKVGLRNI